MSTTIRDSSHVSRKYVSHRGGAISGQGHSGNTSANSLENNLDALLEDLQESVSRSVTPSQGERARSPQVEYRSAANTSKVITESRSLSPTHSKTTTTEKYVTTGPAGFGSGIPGLEVLDAELRDVQPGQSKTVAYKQVSYQYKNVDGKPVDSYVLDTSLTGDVPLVDEIQERTYEESRSKKRHRSPERLIKSSTINRDQMYDENYSSSLRLKQASPMPGTQSKDLKFVRESNYQTEVIPVRNTSEEYGKVEYVPVPSPTPAVPINLAPGPNTKVTTTIKTYTYELPGAPENYLPSGTTTSEIMTNQKNVHLTGDQKITYTLPRGGGGGGGGTIERTSSPSGRFATSTPEIISQKSKIMHKEAKYYQEEIHGFPPSGGGNNKVVYSRSPPAPGFETSLTKNEYYRQTEESFEPDRIETPPLRIDSKHPPTTFNETTTMIDRYEEHYPNRLENSGTSTNIHYYAPQTTPSNTTVYKYSNTTSIHPPNTRHPDDHQVLLPKPFPTGTQVYPSNGKPPANGQGPPAKLEDLMASFSDSERDVLDDIAKQENIQRKERSSRQASAVKKEVEFAPHSPPQVQSKNIAGPPVYYPPGSAEFTKKESAEGAMAHASGGWEKASGKYEYEASSKSKSKSSSGKAIVPVCLPLCCGLPCVII